MHLKAVCWQPCSEQEEEEGRPPIGIHTPPPLLDTPLPSVNHVAVPLVNKYFFSILTSVSMDFCTAGEGDMSRGVGSFQAQVESVLGALVKAASVELIKLFESGYRAAEVGLGRSEDAKGNESSDVISSGVTRRSIGVQVDENLSEPSLLHGMCL